MIWDLIQQWQIGEANTMAEDAKRAAQEVQSENRSVTQRITIVEESLERLSLATMAMAEILRDQFGVTQVQLEAKIQEIDLRDGKLDGRLRVPAAECPNCHHTNASRRQKCLYCGSSLPST